MIQVKQGSRYLDLTRTEELESTGGNVRER